MRVVVDASLLVAVHVRAESHHDWARTWFNEVLDQGDEFILVSHTVAELYAGLTKRGRVQPLDAMDILEDVVALATELVDVTLEDYFRAAARVSAGGLTSGIIYDAVIAEGARQAEADHIATLNRKHFELVWPPDRIIQPG